MTTTPTWRRTCRRDFHVRLRYDISGVAIVTSGHCFALHGEYYQIIINVLRHDALRKYDQHGENWWLHQHVAQSYAPLL